MKNLALFIFVFILPLISFPKDFNVLGYGAKADGMTKDTKAVQAAIDACTQNGGGRVLIPGGKTVIIGTIYLKGCHTVNKKKMKDSPL